MVFRSCAGNLRHEGPNHLESSWVKPLTPIMNDIPVRGCRPPTRTVDAPSAGVMSIRSDRNVHFPRTGRVAIDPRLTRVLNGTWWNGKPLQGPRFIHTTLTMKRRNTDKGHINHTRRVGIAGGKRVKCGFNHSLFATGPIFLGED